MKEVNELHLEFLSILGLNPFIRNNSSPRMQMFSSHLNQKLVIAGGSENTIQTGLEGELAKYTFSTKMPVDGKIIKVIDRYPKSISNDSIKFNPETLVIYEDEKTNEVGCFSINYHTSYHQHFGFQNQLINENLNKLIPGNFVSKDTIFTDSPAITKDNGYKYGLHLNMAFMSHPAVSEDGILISEDVLDKLKFKLYETRTIEFGNNNFPLNLYGSINEYKPFPDIGETIRDDGLLMMLRDYDIDAAPVTMSIYDVMEPDYVFDKPIYVRGGGGKIVDIKVFTSNNNQTNTPVGVDQFLVKYIKASDRYYREIINLERELKSNNRKKTGVNKINLKPELHRLIVEALSMVDEGGGRSNEKLNLVHRKIPLDDYRIEFTVEYEVLPNIGFKMTDKNGKKQP